MWKGHNRGVVSGCALADVLQTVPSLRDSFCTDTISVSLPRHSRAGLQVMSSLTGLASVVTLHAVSITPSSAELARVRRTLQAVARDGSPGNPNARKNESPKGDGTNHRVWWVS